MCSLVKELGLWMALAWGLGRREVARAGVGLAWVVRGDKTGRITHCPTFMLGGKACVDHFLATRATDDERQTVRKYAPNLCAKSLKPLRDKAKHLAEHKTAQRTSDNAPPSEGEDLAEELASLIQDPDIRAYVCTWTWHSVLEILGDGRAPAMRNTALDGRKIIEAIDDAALRIHAINTGTRLERDRKILPITADGWRE